MRRICCVCKAVMGEVPGPEGDSHGYCAGCEALVRREYGMEPTDAAAVQIFKQFWWGGESGKKKFKLQKVDPNELRMGIKVEFEHTDDPGTSAKIALDHLAEHDRYYTALRILEAILKADQLDLLATFVQSIGLDVE